MQTIYRDKAKKYLFDRMIASVEFENQYVKFPKWEGEDAILPKIYSTAWEKGGNRAQIFVNHTLENTDIEFMGNKVTVKALNAEIIDL